MERKKKDIIFHDQISWRFSCPVTWMWVHLYAVPLCFLFMTEISHVFSAARFFCSVLQEKQTKNQLLGILLSLAYLKIVIRDKGKLLSLPFCPDKVWRGGIGLWPVCMLPQKHLPFPLCLSLSPWPCATLMPTFTPFAAASFTPRWLVLSYILQHL